MKITRQITIETNDIQIGDRIEVGHYTATCQKLSEDGLAIFLLDQYLDDRMSMNKESTNSGGYQESNLRKELNSDHILKDFFGLELVPFDNGDLLRLPFYGEVFGHDSWYDSGDVESDDCEQWELMKERSYRIAKRNGEFEWGWLQNSLPSYVAYFAIVSCGGFADCDSASYSQGARPVFQVKIEKEEI